MTFLKHITPYCILLVVLLYATPLQQFLKVPALLEHYKEHKEQKPGITFLDFIVMHYIGDDGVADDDGKDMQLPFKNTDRAPIIEAYRPVSVVVPLQANYYLTSINYSSFTDKFPPNPYPGALLKPPQV